MTPDNFANEIIRKFQHKAGNYHEPDGANRGHIEWNDDLGELFRADDIHDMIVEARRKMLEEIEKMLNRLEGQETHANMWHDLKYEIAEMKGGK